MENGIYPLKEITERSPFSLLPRSIGSRLFVALNLDKVKYERAEVL